MVSAKLSTKLFGVFILGQAVSAAPSPAQPVETTNVEFGAPRQNYKIFGAEDSKPTLKHIEDAMPIAFSDKNAEGVDQWLSILLGFAKCSQNWPMTWFATGLEAEVFPAGQAVSLPVDSKDGKRHVKYAKLDSMEFPAQLVPDFDFKTLVDKAWWPWALLEGVQGVSSNDKSKLDFENSITALSGYGVQMLEGAQLDDRDALLEGIYKKASSSPIWIQDKPDSIFYVALDTVDGGDGTTNVTTLHFPTPVEGEDIDMTRLITGSADYRNIRPHKIVHLSGFPYFKEGGPRVVEWALENPDEPLKPL